MTCDWCGHDHDVRAICSERPVSRGITRRSFVALFSAGVSGLALAPTGEMFQRRDIPAVVDIPSWRMTFVNGRAVDGGDGSREKPYRSLASAVDAAQANDVIVVASGHLEPATALRVPGGVRIIAHPRDYPDFYVRGTRGR